MSKCRYELGEYVVALDKAQLYEAKIIKIQDLKGFRSYYIHYKGWDRKYDTWTDEEKMAKKDDPESLARLKKLGDDTKKIGSKEIVDTQKNFISQLQKGTKTSKKSQQSEKNDSSTTHDMDDDDADENYNNADDLIISSKRKYKETTGEQLDLVKKRRQLLQQDLIDEEDAVDGSKLITIPKELKKILVEDWRGITRNPQKLISLPLNEKMTVDSIINDFLTKHSDVIQFAFSSVCAVC
jgi:hypothetical protein